MKKLFTLFYIALAVGLVFAVTGGIIVHRADVNMGQIYEIIEENLQFGDKNYEFEKSDFPDLTSGAAFTKDKTVYYPLNEFHTLEIYAEKCAVNFKPTTSDDMKIYIDCPEKLLNKVFLHTAARNGSLYVITNWTDETAAANGVAVTIEIPEDYKGGYSVNTNKCTVDLGDIDSSMDISFNLLDTTVKSGKLTAGDFTFEMCSTLFNSESIFSRGSIDISAESTTMNIDRLNSTYIKLLSSSGTYNLKNITGGLTADMQTSTLNLDFNTVKGNVSVTSETGSVNVVIPHNAPVSLHHEESYSSFKENVKWTDKNSTNKNYRYIIDTNVRFSLVTLSEKK